MREKSCTRKSGSNNLFFFLVTASAAGASGVTSWSTQYANISITGDLINGTAVNLEKDYIPDDVTNGVAKIQAPNGYAYECKNELSIGDASIAGGVALNILDLKLQPYNLQGKEFTPRPGHRE